MQVPFCSKLIALGLLSAAATYGRSQEKAESDNRAFQPGHSVHADAFNEGPRQSAYLMAGMGNLHWEISTKNPMAQRFFDQGIVQLHGFWYFEAERSFRQAAAFDPDCAMLYWGMARANIENPFRSKGFIEQAMKRLDKAHSKEKRLVEAWNTRVKDAVDDANDDEAGKGDANAEVARKLRSRNKKKEADKRRKDQQESLKKYVAELESIALDFPDDIEIKAMLVLQYWQNEGQGIDMQSHVAMNSLLSDIFRANPRHPAHHFRIHLWDYRKESLAIDAAAKCGPSAPGIAHMWHMPGHTYSRLHRYADAAWQQEASARVDHAHMMRDHVLPDQIHNFAHNNEWLIRNMMLLGRVHDAIDLAKNMIELPRHPKFNQLDARGSASLGRERLLGVLSSYRMWPELESMLDSPYLMPTENELRKDEHLAWQAIAGCNQGELEKAKAIRASLGQSLDLLRPKIHEQREHLRVLAENDEKKPKAAPRPPVLHEPLPLNDDPFGDENDPAIDKIPSKEIPVDETKDWSDERVEKAIALREIEYRYAKLKHATFAIDAYLASSQKNWPLALRLSNHARDWINSSVRMEWLAESGHALKALEKIEQRVADGPNELLPLAISVWIASKCNLDEASVAERAKKLVKALSPIAATADREIAILKRLEPTIEKLGMNDAWRVPAPTPSDTGDRPALDSLGPIRWSPPRAPAWSAIDTNGDMRSYKQFEKRPLVLILYLGFGCLHCAEQLREFSPMVDKFNEAGIDVLAISSESLAQLQLGLKSYEGKMAIPLLSNQEIDVFKAFHCFDDFEGQPLHGTFLIDTSGHIRWQDKGFQPFMEPKFLLEESVRLLKL
jgi:peroxiredoxin